MLTHPPSRWAIHAATFAVWASAAASAVYWGFKLSSPASGTAPLPVAGQGTVVPDPSAIARLLGSAPSATAAAPAPSLASRFSLVGVAAQGGQGVALIAVDGKPAKPFRVGSQIDEGLVLQSVEARRALLGPPGAAAAVALELPPLRR
jgi:general secretion pathway protein C